MRNRARQQGFSLIEALLVLAIIGIVSGIAIPSYLGQRRRARVIGDAMANAKIMAMMLESQKADLGIYGATGSYSWTSSGSALSILPNFSPSGNTQMTYTLSIPAANSGLAFTITVVDPTLATTAYQIDQTGAQLQRLQ
jgi:prepilin-type N-terminal cleavage/methylation domain-containing protein